jgi:CO/xanthine dehydrogenase Mo-binding subunit
MATVGTNVPRRGGREKVTGAARYVDDLRFPGMLYGRTVRSAIARGRVRSVTIGERPSGLVVVDWRDIPGRNLVALIAEDQPCLVERDVRHAAEPILLLAHEDREALDATRVEIDYEPAEPLYDPARSTTVFKSIAIDKGDVEAGFRAADEVVEGEYRVGHQEHAYIEPNGVIAVPGDGGVTLHGSLQCPYYVLKALRVALGLPDDRLRVVQAETGGGFGGKEEYPSIIAIHACLLALKAGRPVKLVYDRAEDMLATTKRHPAVVRHRTGVTRDGRLTALDVDVLMDGGAYVTLSPVVLSRGTIHATGPYRCDHVRVRGRVVMTNTPPNGAFRGFGAPQTQFAVEVHVERIAERLGLDPVRIREINALRPGDTTATGQRLGRDASALKVLREAVRRTGYRRRRRALAGTGRGLGLALFFHGAGFTGAGEVKLASKAALELTSRGVRILAASADIGQGSRTVHAQIVADAMGLPYDAVEVAPPDTAVVPDSGPTVASRTSMVVGGLLQRCAAEMKRRLGGLTPREYLRRHGPLVITRQYEPPTSAVFDEETYRGDAYGTYAWACDVAEVALDPVTYEVKPARFTAVQEIGRVLHPTLAAGQVEGGSAQGIGYALLEEVVMRDGRMANGQLTNYLVPTTMDTPAIDVVFLESRYRHGPFGAKGLGELPFDGAAPAIVNAVRHLGLDARDLPLTPERVMALCDERPAGPRPRPADERHRAGQGSGHRARLPRRGFSHTP